MEESILWISGRSRSSTAFSRGIVFVVVVAADNAKKVKREFWKIRGSSANKLFAGSPYPLYFGL
jgi:hypothetical protein